MARANLRTKTNERNQGRKKGRRRTGKDREQNKTNEEALHVSMEQSSR